MREAPLLRSGAPHTQRLRRRASAKVAATPLSCSQAAGGLFYYFQGEA